MDEGFSGVARTWSDGASGGDLVTFFLYLGVDVSTLDPEDRLAAFEDALATHPNLVEYGLRGFLGGKNLPVRPPAPYSRAALGQCKGGETHRRWGSGASSPKFILDGRDRS